MRIVLALDVELRSAESRGALFFFEECHLESLILIISASH